ncbi:hypothetical protein N431DRAFT_426269 [Stipitochalara longipes BDJ]|nr:hypothetical protein N431DRAFT_426269 [Stipitochalara longipes BDJ]
MSTIQIPSTPAGLKFAAWLSAFNSGSEVSLREFHEQSFLPNNEFANKSTANDLALRSRTGGFNPQEIITSESTKISVTLLQRSDNERWGTVMVEVEPQGPFYIVRFMIQRQGLEEERGHGEVENISNDAA